VIIDQAGYQPISLKKKIYVIDEVHMLSTAAFNALLKTIEEPSGNVCFILATTELQKVPQTIVSRVQVFNFKKIPQDEMVAHL
jgi:DNA polymerase-3 subunit gamma/tau